MKPYWVNLFGKIDSMSLRERALIFAAAAFVLVSLTKTLFLDPLLAEQKKISARVVQQQQQMRELQAQIDASIQARKTDENSPQRTRLQQAKQQLADEEEYLQNRRDRLVAPDKMAGLLEQVLHKHGNLQLVDLQTLPVAPLKMGKPGEVSELDKQVFKHGVQITVRGSYLDLLQYLSDIEQLPTQMFWGRATMEVVKYPDVELTLTLYTLSLDKTWLQV